MKKRNPALVAIYTILTFGIYGIYWYVVTAREMREKGAQIPNAIMIIIPFVSIYWLYMYAKGLETVTNGKSSAPVIFLVNFLVFIIGMIIVQIDLNELAEGAAAPAQPTNIPVNPIAAAPVEQTFAAATPTETTFTPPAAPIADPVTQISEQSPVAFTPEGPVEQTPVTPPNVVIDQPLAQQPVQSEPVFQPQDIQPEQPVAQAPVDQNNTQV